MNMDIGLNKVYGGIELLKMIKRKKIKEGTAFEDNFGNFYVFKGGLLQNDVDVNNGITAILPYVLFLDAEFRVIELPKQVEEDVC